MNGPLRIAQVSPYDYPYPGGVTRHISDLARHLQGMGHSVKIVAPSSTDEELLDEQVIKVTSRVVSFPFSGSIARISFSPRLLLRIRRILRQESFDVIHLHEPAIPPLSLAVLRESRSVNIGTFHAFRERNPSYEFGGPLLRHFIDRLHGRIAVSQAALDYISAYFPGEYRIIPNGFDVERFAAEGVRPIEQYSGDGRLNVLFVGRLEKRKGFGYLLRAFRLIKATVPEARLLVVGAYSKEDKAPFVRYARHSHLRGVKFIGYVRDEELPRWYWTAHVFCAPSTGFESFGIVLLEAMAAGVPIVASDIPGYRCVLQPGVQGLVVPPADEESLAAAVIRLLRTPGARRVWRHRESDRPALRLDPRRAPDR